MTLVRPWHLTRRQVGVVLILALLSACTPPPQATDPLSLGPASDQGPAASPSPDIGARRAPPRFGGAPGYRSAGSADGTPSATGSMSIGAGGP